MEGSEEEVQILLDGLSARYEPEEVKIGREEAEVEARYSHSKVYAVGECVLTWERHFHRDTTFAVSNPLRSIR